MLLVIYLIIVNIGTFILYGADKKKAEKDKYRIPESSLLFYSVIGGAFGAFLGMRIFHHKTKKKKFTIGMPLIVILEILIIIYFKFMF